MDDLAKLVSELVQRFPDPENFIKEIEKTDKPENEKGDYFFDIGNRLFTMSNFKLALKNFYKALDYFLKFNNKVGAANCFNWLGNTYIYLGNFPKAIEYQNKALVLFKANDDKSGISNCNNSLGNVYLCLSDFHKAIEYYDKALEIYKAIGNKAGETKSFINLGNAYFRLCDFHKAIECYDEALEISKTIDDKILNSNCYINLGNAYSRLSDFRKAIDYYERALEIKKTTGDKMGESTCYTNIGSTYISLGNFLKAIEYQNKALEIFKGIGNKAGESTCYINSGYLYRLLGDYHKAIKYYNKSLEISEAIGDKIIESGCYANLGNIYLRLSDFNKAIEYYNKSLEISKKIGDKMVESACYLNLSNTCWDLGDYHKAIEYCNKSLEIKRVIGDKKGEANCYYFLGNTYHSSGDHKESVEYFKKALVIAEAINDAYNKKLFLGGFGNTYFKKDNFVEAEGYYRQSIEIIENMRRGNIPNEYKRNFWKDNIPIFDNLIISDVKLGKKEEALEYSERGKGRTVFDFILGRGIEEKFKPEPLSFKEIQELAKRVEKNLVLFRVTEKGTYAFIIHRQPLTAERLPSKERKAESRKQVTGNREQGAAFELLEFPDFNSKRLEKLTVKLESGKPAGGWIHAYSNYKSVAEKIRLLLLQEKVVEAGKVLIEEEEKWFKTMDDTLKILYDELMGKVFKRFKKGEKVVIIPNRALNILPLHACFFEESPTANRQPLTASRQRKADSGKRHYLIEDYEISYAPNCNILDLCCKREEENRGEGATRRRDNLFAIANPAPPYNLACSEWEVEEISKLFNEKEVYMKEEVKDTLLDKIANYGIIHFSTHGKYDLGSSFNSKLVLGKDVDLTLEEIFDKIRIDKSWLVSLSACESGLVDYRDIADEYIGLQTGFLYAGAPTVIASLWSVADFTTAFIMIKTYENIFKHGLSKSEALRKAQLWLKDLTAGEALKILKEKELELEYSVKMATGDIIPLRMAITTKDPQSKPFAHPHYWAGFQLFGA